MNGNDGQIQRGRGLVDLIAGVTPTLVDWTNDPIDAGDITDGNILTVCTTGNKIAGAGFQPGYFEWDLGAFYNVLCSGVGACSVSAGTPNMPLYFWDGSDWIQPTTILHAASSIRVFRSFQALASKIRFGCCSSAAATITPNIREFHVWRL